MGLKIIVAVAMNNVIGNKNSLPFHLADDMKHFKEKTVGYPVVCGSTTYFSLPAKVRPLPDRENIVLTRDPSKLKGERVTIVTDFTEVIERGLREELWVIGGAEIYELALPIAVELHLTRVQVILLGDALFPKWDSADWSLTSQERVAADEKNQYNFSWEVWARRNTGPASK
jgi:dihydrofolate reductase